MFFEDDSSSWNFSFSTKTLFNWLSDIPQYGVGMRVRCLCYSTKGQQEMYVRALNSFKTHFLFEYERNERRKLTNRRIRLGERSTRPSIRVIFTRRFLIDWCVPKKKPFIEFNKLIRMKYLAFDLQSRNKDRGHTNKQLNWLKTKGWLQVLTSLLIVHVNHMAPSLIFIGLIKIPLDTERAVLDHSLISKDSEEDPITDFEFRSCR